MVKKNKKIYLIIVGGTCILNDRGHISSVQSSEDVSDWLASMPELGILANIETIFVSGENDIVDLNIWNKVVNTIIDKSDDAEGFVVVSKIDQLINLSLAITFSLQNLNKTIIFTASQVSGTNFVDKKEIINELKNKYGGLSLRSNLINSIQAVGQSLPNPAIMFNTRLISSLKVIASQYNIANIFSSIDNDYWGKVDFGINLKSGLKYSQQKIRIYNNQLEEILVLEDMPGVDWILDKKSLSKYRGLFIKTGPYQELEKKKQDLILKCGLPTVVYNYNLSHLVKGAISISHCTENVAIIKMMWALAISKDVKSFENLMTQNIMGEFLD